MTRRGAALEVRLGAMHETYRAAGVARVHKVHAEARNVRGRIVYSKKGPPDFIGTISGGRSVVFDAKEAITKPHFRLSRVEPHQARDLEACAKLGGLAFLVVSTTAGEWVLRWDDIAPGYWDQSVTVLTADDMDTIGFRIADGDWLAVVGGWR